jgi:hypothetical protein
MSGPKGKHWRERLAALPPERQAKVWAAVRETLRLRREKLRPGHRKNADGDTLH